MKCRDEVLHGLRCVGFKIAAPDNTLFRMEIDQYDRPVGNGRAARDRGPPQFKDNRGRFDASVRKRLNGHSPRPHFADGLSSWHAKFSITTISGSSNDVNSLLGILLVGGADAHETGANPT